MIFRNLTPDGDFTFGAGKQNFVIQQEAIALNIRTRIQSWVGDCFFDLPAGIDWTNRIGNKNQRPLLELDLRRIILQTQDVTEIVTFDTVLNNRNFTARYSVNTIYSQAFQDSVTVGI